MSDLRMELIQGQLNDIEENVRSIKATWGNTIMTLDNIKSSLKADRQKAIDEAYQKGFEAGQHEATTLEYQNGLDEAWEAAKKIFGDELDGGLPVDELRSVFGFNDIPFCTADIFKTNTASEALAKLKAYEQQKANAEIKVGDEVDYKGVTKYVVTGIVDDDTICGFSQNGLWNANTIKEVTKTGRHFPQVAELFKAMKEGAE